MLFSHRHEAKTHHHHFFGIQLISDLKKYYQFNELTQEELANFEVYDVSAK